MAKDGALPVNHIISAAEAAYVTLVCHISEEHKDGEWTNGIIPVIYKPWEIFLRGLYAEVFRAGVPAHGVPIGLHAGYAPVGVLNLSNTVQGYRDRAHWFGCLYTPHGFGIILRLGAVATNDVVVIGGVYEHV
jgi:hypothetical protein